MNNLTNYYPYYNTLSTLNPYGVPYQTSPIIKTEDDVNVEGLMKEDDGFDDKEFAVNVRPEIRKGCVWEVQFRFSDVFLNEFPVHKFLTKVSVLEPEEAQMKDGDYVMVLKIRSKLIEPVKEVTFDKVATCVSNSLRIEVVNGNAALRVKFTARPRNIFHKHADVMILVGTLYRGNEIIAEDSQELIFRGGTGSAHSAENRKLSVLKKSTSSLSHTGYSIPSLYSTPMLYPYTMPPMTTPQTVAPPSTPQQTPAIVRAETLTVPELDEFDSDTFFSDFMNNKGDSLIPFETQETSNTFNQNQYQVTKPAQQQQTNPADSPPAFSFNVTGFQVQPNGMFQGTIEGVYLNKPFRGSFQTTITDTNLQGSFTGTFN